jgi:pheromone a factor receptor
VFIDLPRVKYIETFALIAFTIRAFMKRRKEMEEFLSSGLALNRPTYIRIMLLASVDIALLLPTGAFAFYYNAFHRNKHIKWESWAEMRSQLSYVQTTPASNWKSDRWTSFTMYLNQWVFVITVAVYFAFFGLTEEMRASYWSVCVPVAKLFGIVKGGEAQRSIIVFKNGNRNSTTHT